MPRYMFRCLECGDVFEEYRSINDYVEEQDCHKCDGKARHDFVSDHSDGVVDSQMREYEFYGENGTRMYAAAYLPNQIEEAKKQHPGRQFREVNGCLIPVIKHRRDKLKYLKEHGYVELD